MEKKPLGTLISRAKVEKCGDRNYPILSMTMHQGLVYQSDRFGKQIASVDQKDYNVVYKNQLVEGFPIDEGVVSSQTLTAAGIVSPAYKIWDINTDIIDPVYLEMALRSDRSIQYYKAKLRGSTARRRSITDDDFLELEIPVGSLSEQSFVKDVILKTRAVIENRQNELKEFDELIKARFVEMFGDENNPKGWPVITVEEVADVQVGVVIKPAQYYTDAEHGVKAFRSLNIGSMHIKDGDWVYFTKDGNEKNKKSILKENDLLIVRSGAPGTACVVTSEYAGCNAVDIIIAHPDLEKVNPYYLCVYTNMPHGKRQIEEGTGGAAQQHFNVGKYNKLRLMLPPMEKQEEFVAFMRQVDKSKVAGLNAA